MAPVAGGIADGQEDGLVGGAAPRPWLRGPRPAIAPGCPCGREDRGWSRSRGSFCFPMGRGGFPARFCDVFVAGFLALRYGRNPKDRRLCRHEGEYHDGHDARRRPGPSWGFPMSRPDAEKDDGGDAGPDAGGLRCRRPRRHDEGLDALCWGPAGRKPSRQFQKLMWDTARSAMGQKDGNKLLAVRHASSPWPARRAAPGWRWSGCLETERPRPHLYPGRGPAAPAPGDIAAAWHRGAEIDQALVLWFPAPASFTGEDVAELQIHGGRAVREALFAALAELGSAPGRARRVQPPGRGKRPDRPDPGRSHCRPGRCRDAGPAPPGPAPT